MTRSACALLARARSLAAALIYEPCNVIERADHLICAQTVALEEQRAALTRTAD